MNYRIVLYIVGIIQMLVSGFMLTPLPFSWYHDSGDFMAILYSAIITFGGGGFLWFLGRNAPQDVRKQEGFLIVALSWVAMSAFGALPYVLSGSLPDITDAFFESVSGLTTTGASVMMDIEAMPKGILFWRSLTQWLGGMGIIVLTVALLPLLGMGGVELFVAEAPGPTSTKIHPRIKETAKRLWAIYVGLTLLLAILLKLMGMTFYDAINHGLTTMATGGFSTKNASIAHFESPLIEYTISGFMFVAGINYIVIYFMLHGNFKRAWKSDEFKTYLKMTGLLLVVMTAIWYGFSDETPEAAFRHSLFQLTSLVTTTGFVTADYTAWHPALTLLCFLLLFSGGCAGSTSGGVKIIRHIVLIKNSFLELKRILYPRALICVKVDKEIVSSQVLAHVLVFIFFYLTIFMFGSIIFSFILHDFDEPLLSAFGAVATSLGNVGPSIGSLGPVDNFAAVPAIGKWLLTFFMILGRLELFTIIMLFSPVFWSQR